MVSNVYNNLFIVLCDLQSIGVGVIMDKNHKKVISRYWGTISAILLMGAYFIFNKHQFDIEFLVVVILVILVEQISHNVVMEEYGDKLE